MELNINIGGQIVWEILIDLQIGELKIMIAECKKKVEKIETLMEKLKGTKK